MSEFSHLKNKLLAEQVEDQIYHYILDTPLEPGAKLPNEFELGEKFGVGRSTVREAVKLPLVYVGGLVSRTKIDEVLDAGFDCVAMARALINEPDFVNRMKNEGEERCACTHANYCIARMYSIEMACHKHLHDLPCPVRREVERLDREAWQ